MCRLAVSICLFVFFLGCSSPEERFKEIAKHSADKVKEECKHNPHYNCVF